MSCGNPDCVSCGTSERAQKIRAARQKIVTNPEMMSFIRIIAGNVHQSNFAEYAKRGVMFNEHEAYIFGMEILAGDRDRDPVIQGVIDGFCALLPDEPMIARLEEQCREVKLEDGFLERTRRETEEATQKKFAEIFPGVKIAGFKSVEEMLAFMKGQRR